MTRFDAVAMKIVILEDDIDRQDAMRDCLADRFPMFEVRIFDDAHETVRYLDEHLDDVLLVSLDNDLELVEDAAGRPVDPGDGRLVAEFLAGRSPVCPVIVHSSNAPAAESMRETLTAAGWKLRRVVPFDDTAWIRSDWFLAARRALVGPVRRAPVPRSAS